MKKEKIELFCFHEIVKVKRKNKIVKGKIVERIIHDTIYGVNIRYDVKVENALAGENIYRVTHNQLISLNKPE